MFKRSKNLVRQKFREEFSQCGCLFEVEVYEIRLDRRVDGGVIDF